jgi:hypothetical protein
MQLNGRYDKKNIQSRIYPDRILDSYNFIAPGKAIITKTYDKLSQNIVGFDKKPIYSYKGDIRYI